MVRAAYGRDSFFQCRSGFSLSKSVAIAHRRFRRGSTTVLGEIVVPPTRAKEIAMWLGRMIGNLGCVVGKGILAALAGTAAITVSQAIEGVRHLVYAKMAGMIYDLRTQK
jgi:hypothetical protein